MHSHFIYLETLIKLSNDKVHAWVCEKNFWLDLVNLICYMLIDMIPYCTIFFLHWKNFGYDA